MKTVVTMLHRTKCQDGTATTDDTGMMADAMSMCIANAYWCDCDGKQGSLYVVKYQWLQMHTKKTAVNPVDSYRCDMS